MEGGENLPGRGLRVEPQGALPFYELYLIRLIVVSSMSRLVVMDFVLAL